MIGRVLRFAFWLRIRSQCALQNRIASESAAESIDERGDLTRIVGLGSGIKQFQLLPT